MVEPILIAVFLSVGILVSLFSSLHFLRESRGDIKDIMLFVLLLEAGIILTIALCVGTAYII